jgi:hypothetical protein
MRGNGDLPLPGGFQNVRRNFGVFINLDFLK